ncbi:MAG: hypothetical protein IID38_09480 [Planctomycetes bacterium]|nr:hypothetical protein [Planctomycetota bacterium]
MSKKTHKRGEESEGKSGADPSSSPEKERGINWDDPSVPIGNAPALPRWPLVLAAVAWFASVVFLVVMMLGRDGSGTG